MIPAKPKTSSRYSSINQTFYMYIFGNLIRYINFRPIRRIWTFSKTDENRGGISRIKHLSAPSGLYTPVGKGIII